MKSDALRLPLERVGQRPLFKPFEVVVECVDDDEFIASVPEINVAMVGESAGEAFLILKEHIADLYEVLSSGAALGPEPARQLSILESRLGEEGRADERLLEEAGESHPLARAILRVLQLRAHPQDAAGRARHGRGHYRPPMVDGGHRRAN